MKTFFWAYSNKIGREPPFFGGTAGYGEQDLEIIASFDMAMFGLGQLCTESGRANIEALKALNPDIKILAYVHVLHAQKVEDLGGDWPAYLDYCKHFERYIVDDEAVIWRPEGDDAPYYHVKPWGNLIHMAAWIATLQKRVKEYELDGLFHDYFKQTPGGEQVPAYASNPNMVEMYRKWQRRYFDAVMTEIEGRHVLNGPWPGEEPSKFGPQYTVVQDDGRIFKRPVFHMNERFGLIGGDGSFARARERVLSDPHPSWNIIDAWDIPSQFNDYRIGRCREVAEQCGGYLCYGRGIWDGLR